MFFKLAGGGGFVPVGFGFGFVVTPTPVGVGSGVGSTVTIGGGSTVTGGGGAVVTTGGGTGALVAAGATTFGASSDETAMTAAAVPNTTQSPRRTRHTRSATLVFGATSISASDFADGRAGVPGV